MLRYLLVFVLLIAGLRPLLAEEVVYSVRMKEIFVGKIYFDHEFNEGQFRTKLSAETIGFAKALMQAKMSAEAVGTGEEYRQYLPKASTMRVQTPQFQNLVSLIFSGNQLATYASTSGEASALDFTQYEDIVDPITAFTYAARPTPYDKLCDKRFLVTDGVRVFRVVFLEPKWRTDRRAECKGGVERMEGFTEAEMEAMPNFEFTAVYRQNTEDEYRLDWLVTETEYGSLDIAFHY